MKHVYSVVVLSLSALVLLHSTPHAAAVTACRDDYDCASDETCLKNIVCVNICQFNSVCGANAECKSNNQHGWRCKCKPGYDWTSGSPLADCAPIKPPPKPQGYGNVNRGPSYNNQNTNTQNRGQYKVNKAAHNTPNTGTQDRVQVGSVSGACRNYCGGNALCQLYGDTALCGCASGYVGNPYDRNSGCHQGPVDTESCWSADPTFISQECEEFLRIKKKNRKEFTIMYQKESWTEAVKLCEGGNKMLAIIENSRDQAILENTMINQDVREPLWIAGSDLKRPGRFQWVSGGMFTPMLYTRWHHQEPSGYNRHCVAVDQRYSWASKPCEQKHYFVCQNK